MSTCVPVERLNNWYVVCYSCQCLASCILVMISAQQGVSSSPKGIDFISILIYISGTNDVLLYRATNKRYFTCVIVNWKYRKEVYVFHLSDFCVILLILAASWKSTYTSTLTYRRRCSLLCQLQPAAKPPVSINLDTAEVISSNRICFASPP